MTTPPDMVGIPSKASMSKECGLKSLLVSLEKSGWSTRPIDLFTDTLKMDMRQLLLADSDKSTVVTGNSSV
jgi:hypothetical protein